MALAFKHLDFSHLPNLELAFFLSAAYLSFIVPEELKLSGIMSTLVCAVAMDHYAKFNLSEKIEKTSSSLFEMFHNLAESFLFVYMGMAIFTFDSHEWKSGSIVGTIVWCVLSRLVTVALLCYLLNKGRKRQLTVPEQVILFVSGRFFSLSLSRSLPIYLSIYLFIYLFPLSLFTSLAVSPLLISPSLSLLTQQYRYPRCRCLCPCI